MTEKEMCGFRGREGEERERERERRGDYLDDGL